MRKIKINKNILILSILTITAVITGIILAIRNQYLERNRIEIIDATFSCNNSREKFYEDDNYIYYFPCTKSTSVFVKFPNGNKLLVTKALDENKVTIEQLIKAGLEVYEEEK